MRIRSFVTLCVLMCTLTHPTLADAIDGDGASAAVAGILRLNPVTSDSYVAAWVPVPVGMTLAGVRWYNNDEFAAFPEVRVLSGSNVQLADVGDGSLVASDASGMSLGWSELVFDSPIACGGEGAYVMFQLPESNAATADGAGGGAGVGYVNGGGAAAWATVDGESWVRIDSTCGLALEPIVAAEGADTAGKRNGGRGAVGAVTSETVQFETALTAVAPNPFNPDAEIQFTLKEQMRVSISVYDVRGRRIASLLDGLMEPGLHVVTWTGKDEVGRGAASGVYFVHMAAGNESFSQRVSLVK